MYEYLEFYPQTVTNTLHVQIRKEIFVELKSEYFSVFLEMVARHLFGI